MPPLVRLTNTSSELVVQVSIRIGDDIVNFSSKDVKSLAVSVSSDKVCYCFVICTQLFYLLLIVLTHFSILLSYKIFQFVLEEVPRNYLVPPLSEVEHLVLNLSSEVQLSIIQIYLAA